MTQQCFSSTFSGLIRLLGSPWGAEHCQGPTKRGWNDDHGRESWHYDAFPEDGLPRMAGRKGEVQGCAILDAAIVIEWGLTRLTSRLWPSEPSIFALRSSQKSDTHTSALLIFQCNTWAHQMYPLLSCLCLVFFKWKQGFDSLFVQVLFFNLFTIISSTALSLSITRSLLPAEMLPSHLCGLILPGWMLSFLDNCCQDPNLFSSHL